MRKVLMILSIVFTVLTFSGITYVLVNKGTVRAGYAVIPMVLTVVSLSGYKSFKNKENGSNFIK